MNRSSSSHDFRLPSQSRTLFDPHTSAAARSSRSLRLIPALALLVDLVAVVGAEVVAALARGQIPNIDPSTADYTPRILAAAPVFALVWIVVIAMSGGYRRSLFGAGLEEFKRLTNASVVTAALVGVGCYMLRFPLSRGFFQLTVLVGLAALLLGRVSLRVLIGRARARGRLQQRVVIVGTAAHVDEVDVVISRQKCLGYRFVGAAVPDAGGRTSTPGGLPVLGGPQDVVQVALRSRADVVFFAGGAISSAEELRRTAAKLEARGLHVVLAPSITDVSSERIRMRPVGGLPLIHVGKPRSMAALARMKRTSDIVASSALILAFSPILLLAAFRVWRFDRGPVLFRQERIGVGGQPFGCYKFRTMVVDAEARLQEVLAENGTDHGLFAKLKEDPRITRPGRWMRRYSVDELPQLFNVLKGDMSLIGPRPQVAHEVALYDDAMARRLRVRPGMTGLWQVSGRSDLSVEEAIRLDLYYVDNWSMLQDLSILARTFQAVFGSSGAY
ncbi:sugar transferase [Nocardioides korecus]